MKLIETPTLMDDGYIDITSRDAEFVDATQSNEIYDSIETPTLMDDGYIDITSCDAEFVDAT